MYVTYKSIEAWNFFSYDHFQLEFTQGVNLIDGWNEDAKTSNGSGKSSIFDAISWALYGITPRSSTIDEIIRYGCTSAKVILKFEVGSNSYEIIRCAGPSSLIFLCNGVAITKENKCSLQFYIETILGMTYGIFVHTFYSHQNSDKHFLLLGEDSRKDLLFKILKLDQFDRVLIDIIQDYKDLLQKVAIGQNDLTKMIADIREYSKTHKDYQNRANNYQQEKEKSLISIDNEIKSLEDQTKLLEIQKSGLSEKSETYISNINYWKTLILQKKEELEKYEQLKEERISLIKEREGYLTQQNRIKEDKKTLAISKNCPFCTQGITEETVKKLFSARDGDLSKFVQRIKELDQKILNIEIVVTEKIPQIINDLDILNSQIYQGNTYEGELSQIFKNIKLLQGRRDSLITHRGSVMSMENAYSNLCLDIQRKAQKITVEARKLDAKINEQKEAIIELETLKKIFGPHGVKAVVLEGVLSEINETVKEYMGILYEQAIDVSFKINSKVTIKKGETFKIPAYITINGKEWNFAVLSGGEKRRAVEAVDLALAKVITKRYGNGSNILLLDEVTTDLDEQSRAKFYALLAHISQDRSIWLIEHSYDRYSLGEARIVKVTKSNDISKLEG